MITNFCSHSMLADEARGIALSWALLSTGLKRGGFQKGADSTSVFVLLYNACVALPAFRWERHALLNIIPRGSPTGYITIHSLLPSWPPELGASSWSLMAHQHITLASELDPGKFSLQIIGMMLSTTDVTSRYFFP